MGFEAAARAVLGAHPGVWETAFQKGNTGAAKSSVHPPRFAESAPPGA